MTFVEVILPLALPKTLTYSVPEEWAAKVALGTRVEVQLGQRKVYAALVAKVEKDIVLPYKCKPILSVIDERPILGEMQISLWRWLADYYCCTLGEVMIAAMPAGLKLTGSTRIVLHPEHDLYIHQLEGELFTVAEALTNQQSLSLADVQLILQREKVWPLIQQLVEHKVVMVEETLLEKYTPKKTYFVRLVKHYLEDQEALKEAFNRLEKRAPKQVDVLMTYMSMAPKGEAIQRSVLLEKLKGSDAALNALLEKKILIQEKENVSRLKAYDESDAKHFKLSGEQIAAKAAIEGAWLTKPTVLLHGVTGSGKTQIYMSLIQDALDRGEQVLYLLPEVAITEQITRRLHAVFGDKFLVYHHRVNASQRVEMWNAIYEQRYPIVLGARSAVFLPFSKLGLVIVDEEHDASYKQSDTAPLYQGRDVALYLAQQHQAKTLLGSATPSLESYYLAENDKYTLVEMNQRFGEQPMPDIQLVDLKDETRMKLMKGTFSSVLMEEMEKTIADKKQVLLFQNRRGYAPSLYCSVCGWVPECNNCSVKLTFHKASAELKCHYCGYSHKAVNACGACGSLQMKVQGFGTERVEDELQELLPKARIARMDADQVKNKEAHHQLIDAMEQGEVDILIGTQMVTKGLDFEKVQLVGVLSADNLLNFPDFRVVERAYQLLTQVSGRSGRHEGRGKVLIQTRKTDYPVLYYVFHHDYKGFYNFEINQRRRFAYPPFTRMIHIQVQHKLPETAVAAGEWLRKRWEGNMGKRLLGPSKPGIDRLKGLYIREFLVKVERKPGVMQDIKAEILSGLEALTAMKKFKSVTFRIDVDPA